MPSGFVGMNADGPLLNPHVDLPGQFHKLMASGVQRVRVPFSWALAQPYAKCKDVPADQADEFSGCPGGVPTDFSPTDEIVKLAAKRHLPLLPVVLYTPSWDASSEGNHIQPARDWPYGNFLTALVQRYGPHGTFWSDNPSLSPDPITAWQIWNEPDLSYNWDTQPFARSYVKLLRISHTALTRADPKATVALASLTNYGWDDLESIYKIHGSRHLFDLVAANVYTARPSGVITILKYYRQVMANNGDGRKPITATEVGWPSDSRVATNKTPFSTSEKGQAAKLTRLLPLLARDRLTLRLAGFFYFTWMSTDQGSAGKWWNYSGLQQFDPATDKVSFKPAYWAFRRTAHQLER